MARIFNIQRYSLNDGEGFVRWSFLKAVRIFARGVLIRVDLRQNPDSTQRGEMSALCECLRDADECPSGAFERIGRDSALTRWNGK